METKGRLIVGSRNRKEYVIINANKTGRLTPAKETSAEICQICGDEIKVNAEGKPFVACNECGFPVCIACYDYERREGNQACPRCKTRYKLIKGCPGADGDEEEEDESDDSDSESEYGSKDPQHFSEAAHSSHHSTANASRVTAPNPETHILKYDKEDAGVYSYKHALRIPPFMGNVMKQAQPVPLTDSSTSVPARPMDPKKDKAVDWYGAAVWKQRIEEWKKRQNEKLQVVEHEGDGGDDPEFYGIDEGRQPLSMKLPISSSKMTPYRMTILLRLAVVFLFFDCRIRSPVPDAYGLWLTSVICEIWFAVSWIFNQFPKVFPVERETYLDRLSLRYEKEGKPSELADIDIFVTTVDPMKEPPLITANSILSILAVDYPVEKVACYFSDDGASMLTFEALSETCEFSRKWVPFCKKFNIEPRAPDCYFAQKVDYFQDKVLPAFVKERRAMKREYEEFKVRINGLVAMAQDVPKEGWKMQDGIPWHGNNVRDHRGMIQAFLGEDGDRDVEGNKLPRLIYVSREKRPGFDHHKKAGAMNALVRVSAVISNAPYILNVDCDHYINNSKALREAMCFMMDPISAKKICFVQFPQRFDSIDRHDRYPYPNAIFFNVNMKGLDGIQGPIYVGTGCVFRRQALYGWKKSEPKWCCCGSRRKKSYTEKSKENQKKTKSREASLLEIFAFETTEEGIEGIENEKLPLTMLEKKFGQSPDLISSTLLEEGGVSFAATFPSLLKEAIHVVSCSFEYKTKWGKEVGWIYGSGILTGFKMHCDGWRSVYCIPKRPAFKGSTPINLSDHMRQVLGSALEAVDIFLSKDCPIWYGYGRDLDPLERFSYINSVVYPLTSIPLITYCTLPAICLLTGKFIIPEFSDYAVVVFMALFTSVVTTSILEMQWGGVTLDDWWRNEQCWVIDGVSSHLFALFQGILKFFTGVKTNITFPSRGGDDGEVSKLSLFKWTSLLILPATLLIINIIGVVVGVLGAIINGYNDWGLLFGKLLFSLWVIVHLYPFLKGMMGKQAKVPTIILIWTIPLACIFLLLWLRVNPFVSKDGIVLEVCGLDCN